MKIALLVPTRERIGKKWELVLSIINTVDDINNIKLYFGIDEDDPTRAISYKMAAAMPFIEIIDIKNEYQFIGLSELWNRMYTHCEEDILSMTGDDMIFETSGWDTKIINEFSGENLPLDRIKMVHCNDGMRWRGNKLSNIPPLAVNHFLHRRYAEIIGRYVQGEIPNLYHDTWIHIVFDALGRRFYHHDIMIRHKHIEMGGIIDGISNNLESLRQNHSTMWQHVQPKIQEEIEILRDIINCK